METSMLHCSEIAAQRATALTFVDFAIFRK
jgi:hypothetical protein